MVKEGGGTNSQKSVSTIASSGTAESVGMT